MKKWFRLVNRFRYEVLMMQVQQNPMGPQERDFLLSMTKRFSDERTALKLRVRKLEALDETSPKPPRQSVVPPFAGWIKPTAPPNPADRSKGLPPKRV